MRGFTTALSEWHLKQTSYSYLATEISAPAIDRPLTCPSIGASTGAEAAPERIECGSWQLLQVTTASGAVSSLDVIAAAVGRLWRLTLSMSASMFSPLTADWLE